MSRVYSKRLCTICGRELGANGAAQTNHMRRHVRQGDAEEYVDTQGSEDARLWRAAFRLTEQGQEKEEVILRSRRLASRWANTPSG